MSELEIRNALPQDKESVLQFCQQTWEYGDYIPQLWDEWLDDPDGKLIVGVYEKVPVAMAHVTLVAPREAWVEGLRVAPTFRNKGIGVAVARYCIKVAAKSRAVMIRFVTLGSNTAARRIGDKLNFQEAASFLSGWAESKGEPTEILTVLKPEVLEKLFRHIEQSKIYWSASGLYCTGWAYHRLTQNKLLSHLTKGEVVALGGLEEPSAIAIVTSSLLGQVLVAGYTDGVPETIAELALALKVWAAKRFYRQVDFRLPNLPEFQNVFPRVGYVPYFCEPYLIFELRCAYAAMSCAP